MRMERRARARRRERTRRSWPAFKEPDMACDGVKGSKVEITNIEHISCGYINYRLTGMILTYSVVGLVILE